MRPFISRLATVGYALVPQAFLKYVLKKLSTLDHRLVNIKQGVQPWVIREIQGEIRNMQTRFDRFKWWISQKLEGIQAPNL